MAFKTITRHICWLGMVVVLLTTLTLSYTSTYAYAQDKTASTTTEVYLAPETSSEVQKTTLTSSTTKTGDTTPVIPFVIAGVVAAAAITGIAYKKHTSNKNNTGGENL